MLPLKLALRNLLGAGIRSWLNIFVLSLAYVAIIWHQGMLEGWNRQARQDTIQWEIGGGQIRHIQYDPYDPFTLDSANAPLPGSFREAVSRSEMVPVLVWPGTAYFNGNMLGVLLKGIPAGQKIVALPTDSLRSDTELPAVILGQQMASLLGVTEGDFITLRWRNRFGAMDARDFRVAFIFATQVPTVDAGQIWLDLDTLYGMLGAEKIATYLVCRPGYTVTELPPGWLFYSPDALLSDLDEIIRQKSVGGMVFYGLLLALAFLAIFDTQVLNIFRRRKEIGTLIALGMPRSMVIFQFTLEGALHAILAALLAAVYGIPLLAWQAKMGIAMPKGSQNYGLAIGERIFPYYSVGLVVLTVFLVCVTAFLVSYLPARKISGIQPTEALRGRVR